MVDNIKQTAHAGTDQPDDAGLIAGFEASQDVPTDIPVTEINLTGVTSVTIGANGEVVSIVKDGQPPVVVPPASTVKN